MNDYILLMHNDATHAATANDADAWESYLTGLRKSGCFDGGSAIGKGASFRKIGQPGACSEQLTGYLRLRAQNLEHAQSYLPGNPVFEAGGTVEIRELPPD